MKVLLFAALIIAYTNAFCFHQYGGIGEVHRDCPDSGGKLPVELYDAYDNLI